MNIQIKNISLIQGYLFKFLVILVLTLELTNSSIARAKEVPTARKMLDQAQNHYLQGDYNRAILLLNELLTTPQQIDSVTVGSNLAEIYRHLGQYSQAIAHWKTAIESIETKNDEVQKPKLIALKIDLARAYTHLGQTSLAIPLLKEAIILAFEFHHFRFQLIQLLLSN